MTRIGCVDLAETLEDGIELVVGYAPSLIGNAEGEVVRARGSAERDRRSGRREFDGVADEVRQRLDDAVAVAPERSRGRFRHDADTCLVGDRLEAFPGLVHDRLRVNGAARQFDLAGLDSLQIEDVVDEPHQTIGIGDGDLQHPLPLFGDRTEQPAAQQTERSANGSQRGAQLVADRRDELALQPLDGPPFGDVAEHHDGTELLSLLIEHRRG